MPLLHLRGVPLGGPEGYGTHPRVLGRYTPAVECVSTNINGSKARYRILNLMKRPLVYTSGKLHDARAWTLSGPVVAGASCVRVGVHSVCAATCRA